MRTFFVAVIVLMLVSVYAFGAEMKFENSYQDAVKKAKKEQKLIMIIMLSPNWTGRNEYKTTIITDATVIDKTQKLICVLVDPAENTNAAKKFPSPPPQSGYPYTVFVSPDEQLVSDFVGLPTPQALRDNIDKATAAWDSVKFQSDRKTYQKDIDKAVKLIEDKKYQEAIQILQVLLKTPEQMGICRAAQQHIGTLNNIAQRDLDDAIDLIDKGKKDEAIAGLKKIYATFKGISAADDALAELKKLGVNVDELNPAAKPVKKPDEQKPDAPADEKTAKTMLDEAKKLESDGKLLDAMNKYNTAATKYPNTDAGKKASEEYKRLGKNEKVLKLLESRKNEKQCKSLLSAAKNFIENKKYDDAAEYLEKIIKLMPDSDYAKESQKLLDEINKK